MDRRNKVGTSRQGRIAKISPKDLLAKVIALLLAYFSAALLEGGALRQSYAGVIDLDDYGVPSEVSGKLQRKIDESIQNIEKQYQKIEIPKPDALDLRKFLVVEFTGGTVGDNMAQVLAIIRSVPQHVITFEAFRIGSEHEGQGECEIFAGKLWPEKTTCTESLIREIRELHKIGQKENHESPINSGPIVGSNYYIPLVGYTESLVKRFFDVTIDADIKSLERVESNWKDLIKGRARKFVQPSTGGTGKTIQQRDILSVKWHMPLKSGVDEVSLNTVVLQASRIPNVAAYTLTGNESSRPKFFTFTPDELIKRLQNDADITGVEGDYRKYLSGLYETNAQCEGDKKATVEIIDTAVARNPDLLTPVFGEQPSSPATTAINLRDSTFFSKELHHGTYLAGIVASAHNDAGFSGIAENGISVDAVIYFPRTDRDKKLREHLINSFDILNPTVYLFATTFEDFPFDKLTEDERNKIWANPNALNKILKNPSVRFDEKLINRWIKRERALFVTAAGQNDHVDQLGIPIDARVPMSPQNLGDQDNMIVVAACEECGKDATLWGPSNYSGGEHHDRKFVHLLAPGGTIIPGLLSENEIGTTIGGTSAASAFVAAVAADIVACYPSEFRGKAGNVKQWLMLTARPDGDPSLTDKVAAGVIDPAVAMLHPKKNWLKRDGQTAEEVQKLNWCSKSLEWADDEQAQPKMMKLRRLSRINDEMEFVATQSFKDESADFENIRFERFGPGKLDRKAPLALIETASQDSCAISAEDIADLIVSPDGDRTPVNCSAARRCFGTDQ